MQTIKKTVAIGLLLGISSILSAFSHAPGGDKFEIYLNNKLILEEYISQKSTPMKYLTLYPGNYNNRVDIYYSHCGQTGTDRRIIIKDEQNKIIKKWEFADAKGDNKAMTCKAKDIMDLQKGKTRGKLGLYYASDELPKGRLLATVVISGDNFASVQP